MPAPLPAPRVEVDGKQAWGIAADVLPNKWFTKDPASAYRDDIADMLKIIGMACEIAVAGGSHEVFLNCGSGRIRRAGVGGWMGISAVVVGVWNEPD